MTLVVIANDSEKQNLLAAQLEGEADQIIALSSLADLPELLINTAVSGILLDLVTSTRAGSAEKEATNELIQLYPHLKFKVVNNDIIILGGTDSLQQFARECRKFKERKIRRGPRKVRHIAFIISADSSFEIQEKTVSLNISDNGCFVYSTNEWKAGDTVWLRFADNDRVIRAKVCWWQPWGNNKKMPGIGIEFD
jgi:hypothetical protein